MLFFEFFICYRFFIKCFLSGRTDTRSTQKYSSEPHKIEIKYIMGISYQTLNVVLDALDHLKFTSDKMI